MLVKCLLELECHIHVNVRGNGTNIHHLLAKIIQHQLLLCGLHRLPVKHGIIYKMVLKHVTMPAYCTDHQQTNTVCASYGHWALHCCFSPTPLSLFNQHLPSRIHSLKQYLKGAC